jgi:nicotinamide-nucleotide amidase
MPMFYSDFYPNIQSMFASVITIGDEILLGQTIDTNSAWLGKNLSDIGMELKQVHSISDSPSEIVRALNESLAISDLVIITGGLGPTNDDLTKKTLVDYFGSELIVDQEILLRIENYFRDRKLILLEVHRQQALLPKNAQKLINNHGTASGMWFEQDGKVIISLPGVPNEMKGIMMDFGLKKIAAHFHLPFIYHRTVLTWGRGESFIANKIEDWELSCRKAGIGVAFLPSVGIVKIRVSIKSDLNNVKAIVDQKVEELYQLIPNYIFGENDERLEEKVGAVLSQKKRSIATAESCTGGYIAHLLTSVAGSSDYFKGSIVAYSNEVKSAILGVSSELIEDKGEVSEEVVIEMARNIRTKFNTDYGIASTGFAGPDGGNEHYPVGAIWIAIASENVVNTKLLRFGNRRFANIKASSIICLGRLLKEIQE